MQNEQPKMGQLALAVLAQYPRQTVATFMAVSAAIIIIVNALFLQPGQHPAPIFALERQPAPVAALDPAPPRPRVVEAAPPAISPAPSVPAASVPAPVAKPAPVAAPSPRNRGDIITDIQRELARKGFYDAAVDGIWGSRTDMAIRDFAQAAGLRFAPEASEDVLNLIAASPVTKSASPRATTGARETTGGARHDPIAEMLTPPREIPMPAAATPAQPNTRRILAVQRALSEFGYGQIRLTGTMGPETQAGIERFERSRRIPVTGQLSDRLLRELAVVTGQTID
ncbi:MAG TPA: peptidoglycan-binding domain-containing protein [Pseudolabrys sp.]|nr:peptidoglycan-binding domain-containing protein [Pseudolabrys sp.]